MEEEKDSENRLTSAAAFVEGGIQEACDDACSICLEDFCESDPSTVQWLSHLSLLIGIVPSLFLIQKGGKKERKYPLMSTVRRLIMKITLVQWNDIFYNSYVVFSCRLLLANMSFTSNASLSGIIWLLFNFRDVAFF